MARYDQKIATRFTIFRRDFIAPTQAEAAKKLGCSQSKISEIESAKQTLDFDTVSKMMSEYSLNAEWLATGEGNSQVQFKKQSTSKNARVSKTDLEEIVQANSDLLEKLQMIEKFLSILQVNQNHFINVVQRGFKNLDQLEKDVAELKDKMSIKM